MCIWFELTKGGLDDVDNSLASIDVGDDLTAALSVLGTLFHDHDLWRLHKTHSPLTLTVHL